MKKTVSFGVAKFKGLLLAGTFTVLVNYVIGLSDAVIAGQFLGEAALAGVNLVTPLLSIGSFLAGLIATGMATEYSLAMGRCDKTRARQFFVQGLWSVLLICGAFALSTYFFRDMFLGFFGASPDVSLHAHQYLTWTGAVIMGESLQMLLVSLAYADGDARLAAISYTVSITCNFALSILNVKLGLGTAGCSLGSAIAEALGCLILCLHFFSKSNSFAYVRHFSLRDTLRIAAASFGDAAAFLCDGLLFIFLNKYVILNFGSGVLPVVGAAAALWGLLELFNGIGTATQPIVTVYYGEGNTRAIRTVMASAMRVAVAEGVAVMAFAALFPSLFAKMVGISDPELIGQTVVAVRCMCGGFVALALAGLFNSYYMFVERSALAGTVTFLCYLLMPIAMIACGSIFSFSGVWVGLGVGPFVGLVITAIVIVTTAGWESCPLLLPRSRDKSLTVFDLELTEEKIAETSRLVGERLKAQGADASVAMRASLLTEEAFLVVRERNPKKRVLGEVTLDLKDGITLTLRDDGEIFDITDADASISSLRTYLVASMMREHDGRMNLVTTGFNRNVFRF